MVDDLITNKKVALYTGCFANYYYPEEGKAIVKVLNKNGINIVVPDQVCCGLPMMAKGNTKGAYKSMEYNTKVFSQLVLDGYALITPCSSCSLFIKRDYPMLLQSEKANLVSQNMYHFSEYLLKLRKMGELNTNFKPIYRRVFYHTPCHLRAQKIGDVTVEMLKLIPGIIISHISHECCGMGGAYGYEKRNYKLSKEIGSKLFNELEETPCEQVLTDCGGCKLQIESSAGIKVEHPILLLQEAYNFDNF